MRIVYTDRTKLTELDLYECGMQDCKPLYTWGPAVRNTYYIHYVRAGSGTFKLRDKLYYPEKGMGFVIRPGEISRYQADGENPWSYCWVAFHGSMAEEYLRRGGLGPECPVFSIAEMREAMVCFDDMMEAAQLRYGRELYLTGLLYRLLSIQIEAYSTKHPFRDSGTKGRKERYIDAAVGFIQANYSRDIGIREISHQVGLDGKYLSSLFTEYLGVSPYRFLIGVRMDKACEMMSNDLLTIGDIARSVGYKDPLLFSRMFRKVKGSSPRHYRQNCMTKSPH